MILMLQEHPGNSLLALTSSPHYLSERASHLICVRGTDAILGVALFKEQAPNSFGRFNRAFVSMFRIAGGETWIDGLPFLDDSGDIYWKSSLFVCSYLVLNVWVVLQVRCQTTMHISKTLIAAEHFSIPSISFFPPKILHPPCR